MLRSSAEHYRRQQRLAVAAVASGRRAWRMLDQADLDATVAYQQALLPVLTAAQLNAATGGSRYVERALAEQDVDVEPAGRFRPDSLAGVASDGRPLSSLLTFPLVRVKSLIGQGMSPAQAMSSGSTVLDMIMQTQVADAGRVAEGVGIAARPRVGYLRMVNAPACSRCVILAGRWYRFSAGFQRHPFCDCIHIPSLEGAGVTDLRTNPKALFDADQITDLSKADAKAIRDGADMNRVVNARRGMSSAAKTRTSRRAQREARLMPEQIYRDAPTRQDAVDLLRLHGYLI